MINDALTHFQIINGENSLFYFSRCRSDRRTSDVASRRRGKSLGLARRVGRGTQAWRLPRRGDVAGHVNFLPATPAASPRGGCLLCLPILLMVIVIIAIFKENIFRPPMTQSETLHFLFFFFPNRKCEPPCPEEALGKETPRGHKRPLATWLQTHAADCLVRRWQPSSSSAAATSVTAEKTAVLWKAVNIGYKSSHQNPARKTPAVPFAASSHDTWTSAISSVGRLLARALSSVDSLRVPWQFTNCTTSPSWQTYPLVRGWPENRP